jgi:hypothetical protein
MWSNILLYKTEKSFTIKNFSVLHCHFERSREITQETPYSLSSWGTKDLRLLNRYRWTSLYGITCEDTSFLSMTKLRKIETEYLVWFLVFARNDRPYVTLFKPKTIKKLWDFHFKFKKIRVIEFDTDCINSLKLVVQEDVN